MKSKSFKIKTLLVIILSGVVFSAVVKYVRSHVDNSARKSELIRVELPFDYRTFAAKTVPLPVGFQTEVLDGLGDAAKIKFEEIKDVFPHKDFIRIVLGGFVGLNVNGVSEIRQVAMNLDLRVEPRDGRLYVVEVIVASIRPFEATRSISDAIAAMASELKLVIDEKIDRSAMPLLDGAQKIKEMTKAGIVVYRERE